MAVFEKYCPASCMQCLGTNKCADDALLHNQLKHVPHHTSEELLLPAGLTDKVMTEFGFPASGEIQKDLYKCAVKKLESAL